MVTQAPYPGTRFVTLGEAAKRVLLSTSQILARVEDGSFPPPRIIFRGHEAFLEHEIVSWMVSRPTIEAPAEGAPND